MILFILNNLYNLVNTQRNAEVKQIKKLKAQEHDLHSSETLPSSRSHRQTSPKSMKANIIRWHKVAPEKKFFAGNLVFYCLNNSFFLY